VELHVLEPVQVIRKLVAPVTLVCLMIVPLVMLVLVQLVRVQRHPTLRLVLPVIMEVLPISVNLVTINPVQHVPVSLLIHKLVLPVLVVGPRINVLLEII